MGEVKFMYESNGKMYRLSFSYAHDVYHLPVPGIKALLLDKADLMRGDPYYNTGEIASSFQTLLKEQKPLLSAYLTDTKYFSEDLSTFLFEDDKSVTLDETESYRKESAYNRDFRLLIIEYRFADAILQLFEKEKSSQVHLRAHYYLLRNRYYLLCELYERFYVNRLYRVYLTYFFDDFMNRLGDALKSWLDVCMKGDRRFFEIERQLDREWEIKRAVFQCSDEGRAKHRRNFLTDKGPTAVREECLTWFLSQYDMQSAKLLLKKPQKKLRWPRLCNRAKDYDLEITEYQPKESSYRKSFSDYSDQRWYVCGILWAVFSFLFSNLCWRVVPDCVDRFLWPGLLAGRSVLILVIYVGLLLYIIRMLFKPTLFQSLQLPRLIAGTVIGYLLLFVSISGDLVSKLIGTSGTKVSFFEMSSSNMLVYVCSILLIIGASAWYLTAEIYKDQKDRFVGSRNVGARDTRRRVFRILFQGLYYSFIIGLVFSDLFGSFLGDPKTVSFSGLFGKIYPMIVFFYTPLAVFIGIFTQLLWEDKPISHPL